MCNSDSSLRFKEGKQVLWLQKSIWYILSSFLLLSIFGIKFVFLIAWHSSDFIFLVWSFFQDLRYYAWQHAIQDISNLTIPTPIRKRNTLTLEEICWWLISLFGSLITNQLQYKTDNLHSHLIHLYNQKCQKPQNYTHVMVLI